MAETITYKGDKHLNFNTTNWLHYSDLEAIHPSFICNQQTKIRKNKVKQEIIIRETNMESQEPLRKGKAE